jgi:hypothetical protein
VRNCDATHRGRRCVSVCTCAHVHASVRYVCLRAFVRVMCAYVSVCAGIPLDTIRSPLRSHSFPLVPDADVYAMFYVMLGIRRCVLRPQQPTQQPTAQEEEIAECAWLPLQQVLQALCAEYPEYLSARPRARHE